MVGFEGMKLVLISSDVGPKHFFRFQRMLGKPKADKALFISAAAVPYGLEPKPDWLNKSLETVKLVADHVDETSLEDDAFVPEDLSSYDFIFVAGGNTFYLAYRLAKTGLDEMIKKYIADGKVYAGSSAGAIILMDSIEEFASADDPEKAPEKHRGLGVIDFAIIPHMNDEKYGPIMKQVAEDYQSKDYETVTLDDGQVLFVEDLEKEVI